MYCQKCRTPLKLDSSLEDLNPAAFDLLVGQYLSFHPKEMHTHLLTFRCDFPPAIKEHSAIATRISARKKAAV